MHKYFRKAFIYFSLHTNFNTKKTEIDKLIKKDYLNNMNDHYRLTLCVQYHTNAHKQAHHKPA